MAQGYGQHQSQEPVLWDRVEWRQGDGRYTFQVASGGLLATLTSPHGSALTLPMVAWEGLLDALAAQRKTRTRAESKFPARSGARWYDGETGELATAFKGGRSIRQLARAHNRTELAVEAELARQGLWDRMERRPKQADESSPSTDEGPQTGTAPSPRVGSKDRQPASSISSPPKPAPTMQPVAAESYDALRDRRPSDLLQLRRQAFTA